MSKLEPLFTLSKSDTDELEILVKKNGESIDLVEFIDQLSEKISDETKNLLEEKDLATPTIACYLVFEALHRIDAGKTVERLLETPDSLLLLAYCASITYIAGMATDEDITFESKKITPSVLWEEEF